MTTDDQFKEALTTLIAQITDWSNHAAQFGTDMVPELIRQYLMISYWKCLMGLGGCVLFVVLTIAIALGTWRWARKDSVGEVAETAKIMSVILVLLSLFLLGGSLCTNVPAIMTIKMAPYVYILQNASGMVGLK